MQNQVIFPDCPCCGEHFEKKNRILDGLFQCPKCKNEHYFINDYKEDVISQLSAADKRRDAHRFDQAYSIYESIMLDHPSLLEAYWGLFLSTYGVIYVEENKNNRYIPSVHQFNDEIPTLNQHFLKVIELSTDKHMKNHYLHECEFISKKWESVKPTVKTDQPVTTATQVVEPEVFTFYQSKEIGKDFVKGYTIDPLVENKINSAEQIYLTTKKYSRACKVFDEVLKVDPLAQKALWDKILCTLEIISFDELSVHAILDPIYKMFDQLMGCIQPTDGNIYLHIIETHLFKKLSEGSEFDRSLFEFIMSWKNKEDQKQFSNRLYQEILTKLNNGNITTVDFIHQALAQATKAFPKQDSQFTNKYMEIAEKVNQLEFYKDSLILVQVILSTKPNFVPAILIELCATYKVPEVSELHRTLKDMKFVETVKHLLNQGYKALEIFVEIKLAILSLIEQEKYKLANQMIESYIELLPEEKRDVLNQSLLEFSKALIYHQQFKVAKKYVSLLIENDNKIPAAHWAMFMILKKSHTNFELLLKSPKKDLMSYPDFERAVNCTRDRKEYIRFYEIQDQLKEATHQNKAFKRMVKRNFDYFDDQFNVETVERFVKVIFPQINNEVPRLYKSRQMSIFNLVNRTVLMSIIIAFALIVSHMKILFDPTLSNDSLIISNQIFVFFRDIVILILIPGFLILYLFIWVREKENLGKAILGGLLSGLIASIIALIVLGVIPWTIARFMTPLLIRFTPFLVPSVMFSLATVSAIFILGVSHLKLVSAKVNSQFIKSSIVNIIILSLVLIAGIAITLITLI